MIGVKAELLHITMKLLQLITHIKTIIFVVYIFQIFNVKLCQNLIQLNMRYFTYMSILTFSVY